MWHLVITTIILHITDGLFHLYLDTNSIRKTFIDGIINDYCSFKKKTIIGDFYSIDHSVSNINIDGFINEKNMPNTNIYHYHFSGNSIGEYFMSLTKKIICNFHQ